MSKWEVDQKRGFAWLSASATTLSAAGETIPHALKALGKLLKKQGMHETQESTITIKYEGGWFVATMYL